MRTPVRLLIVVVCLVTAVAGIFGAKPHATVNRAGRSGQMPADTGSHRQITKVPRDRIASTNTVGKMVSQSSVAEDLPANSIENKVAPSIGTKAFDEFDQWIESYAASTMPDEKRTLERAGETLARERRAALARVIESDPERAIRLAVPMRIRQILPTSISKHLEERVSGLARFDVLAFTGTPGQPQPPVPVERYVTIKDRTYKAFVYGRRVTQTSKEAIPIHGIAIGNVLAVHESPVRPLEPGELPDPSAPVSNINGRCPVSKLAAKPTIAADVGGEVVYFCHLGHVEALNQDLEEQEAGIGPATRKSVVTPDVSPWTHGPKTVLFIRINFSDDLTESITESQAYDLMARVNQFFVENSYGAVSLSVTVTPVLTMPRTKASYTASLDYLGLLYDARAAAAAVGFDTANFDLDCAHFTPVFPKSYAQVGQKGAGLQDQWAFTACHEFGHCFGLNHASAWYSTDGSVIGAGINHEYGNPFDTMGVGGYDYWEFNACYKYQLGWLPDASVQTLTSDGVYRLFPFDVPSLGDGLSYALKIRKDDQRDYWLETRQTLAINPLFLGGVLINRSPWTGNDGRSELLDMTPDTHSMLDAALVLGRSFYDPALGLKVTPLNLGGTTPESVDVRVEHVHFVGVEAEAGKLLPPTRAINDPLASQGQCVASLAGLQGGVIVTVTIPADGSYVIWNRILQGEPGAVSVSVDGELGASNLEFDGAASSQWHWSRIARRVAGKSPALAPQLFTLTAGTHTIRLAGGGAGSKLDCLVFTDDLGTNPPPVLATIADQSIVSGTSGISIPVSILDVDTPVSALTFSASSSNTGLVPNANLVFSTGNTGPMLSITSTPNQLGTAVIIVCVTDPNGNQVQTTFSVKVIGPVQALVNAASPRDVINIPAGTYADRVVINKDLTLQGAGAVGTILDSRGIGTPLTIASNVTVTVRDLTLRNGRSSGLRNFGVATLERCAVRDNWSSSDGGGIWNGDAALLILQHCTINSNRCTRSNGGGIYNAGWFKAVTVTISCNRAIGADGGNGGGIYNANTMAVHNSTLYGNNAANNGGGIANFGITTLRSSIVAGNNVKTGSGSDNYGTIQSAGFNLFQTTQGFTITGDTTGNLTDVDPRLGPLQNNGGPTLTHALLPDSPAIDHGSTGESAVDQRGVSRPLDVPDVADADDACDIGAYESIPDTVRELKAYVTAGTGPGTLAVHVALLAQGDENQVSFGLLFPSALMNNPRVVTGRQAPNATVNVQADPNIAGRLNINVSLPAGQTFPVGDHDLLIVEFDPVGAIPSGDIVGLGFDTAGPCMIYNATGQELSALYRVGSSRAGITPRLAVVHHPNGDVTIRLSGGSGNYWVIQASTDFATWHTVGTILDGADPSELNDPSARDYPILFYRAVVK